MWDNGKICLRFTVFFQYFPKCALKFLIWCSLHKTMEHGVSSGFRGIILQNAGLNQQKWVIFRKNAFSQQKQ